MDVPESEAWRQKRAEELGVTVADAWALPHPRDVRVDVAPMRPVVALPTQSPTAARSSAHVRPAAVDRPLRDPPSPRPPSLRPASAAPKAGGMATASAIIAGLLFAAAAGWQARDLLDPTTAVPTRVETRPTPRAAPIAVARPAPLRCDDPAVVSALRARIATGIVREGGGADWSARVAAESRLQVAPPSVTSLTDRGSRLCATQLTIRPPGRRQDDTASVTYLVGATGGLSDVQGDVGLIGRVAFMGKVTPPEGIVPPVQSSPQPPVKPVSPKPVATARTVATREPVKPVSPKSVATARTVETPVAAKTNQPAELITRPDRAASKPAASPPPAPPPPRVDARPTPIANALPACADVWSRAEAMICASPALKARHRALTTTLDRILLSGEAVPIKRAVGGQRRFLARRDDCRDAACIANRYDDRLADLAKIEAKGRGAGDN